MKLKQLKIDNTVQRQIYGELLEILDLDYSQNIDELKLDIEDALSLLPSIPSISESIQKQLQEYDVRVYRGGSHLDIVINGVGTLNWLTVMDTDLSLLREELPPLKELDASLGSFFDS